MFPSYGGPYFYGEDIELTATSPVQTFTEPLTLAEVKDYLSLTSDPEFTDDDSMLKGFIAGAREVFEIEQGYDLMVKQWDKTLDYFTDWKISLRKKLISVDLVSYRDSDGNTTALVANTDYVVNLNSQPGIITPKWENWWPQFTPWASGSVLVRFTAGIPNTDPFWNNEGARLKTGMLVLIKSWYIGNDSTEPQNQTGIPWAAQVLMRYGGIPRVR